VTSSDRQNKIENVVIVGSGPAGYTAALYTSRASLAPLVIEGFLWGGLLQQTTDVENYPGFPEGIMGPELMQKFRDQAERFGTRFVTDQATKIELSDQPGGIHSVWVGDDEYRTRTVILAMGAEHKKLGIVGEDELGGRGVSYCATCDAAFFRDKPAMIVGGGDSAMEEAIFLSKFASKVIVVHRRDEFRASKIMLERARAIENIEWMTPYGVEEFVAGDNGALHHARLEHRETGERRDVEISGAFIAIGHEPQSELVAEQVQLDDEGYVITEGRSTRTARPGVFASGDLVDHTYRQAVTAAGSGTQAALDAEWYLRDTPEVQTPVDLPEGDLAEAQWAPPRS
jgi:thioredoxin reductase (NADPH)